MPDLIIKPTNTSGNKVIIQDQAGGAVLTTADSGATATNVTLSTGSIATAVTGFAGIKNSSVWRLTSTADSSDLDPITNWEKNDTAGNGSVGADMTESSGIFTFPATGMWEIYMNLIISDTNSQAYFNGYIKTTQNNNDWINHAVGQGSCSDSGSSYVFNQVSSTTIFDVTNVSTHKARFAFVGLDPCNITGNGDTTYSFVKFTRIGDT
jgi:hypothetical protein